MVTMFGLGGNGLLPTVVVTMKLALIYQVLTNCLLFAGTQGKLIMCVCTTGECQEQNNSRCNTTHMCYSQYLDRGDGSNPLTKGCINSKTPLLCENRRPAVSDTNWPVLRCCNTNMCNQNPVIPQLTKSGDRTSAVMGNTTRYSTPDANIHLSSPNPVDEALANKISFSNNDGITSSNNTISPVGSSQPRSHFIGPVYIGVMVVGVCSLVVIGIVAMMVLRRHDRLCDTQYATIERNGYFKAHQPRSGSREDPELQLPRQTNGIYDNKVTVNT